MTRIVLDPIELAALAALCRNASYDAAGIATEARHRTEDVHGALTIAGRAVEAAQLGALVEDAASALLRASALLDDDALLLAAIGQRSEAADAIAEAFGGGEHALLTQLRSDPGQAR